MRPVRTKITLFGLAAAATAYGVYAGLTYVRYGAARGGHETSRLDAFMPDFEVRDAHERRVSAPPSVTFETVAELSIMDSPLLRAIFGLRELPSRIGKTVVPRATPRPLLDEVRSVGWQQLVYEPDQAVVMAAVTQPWHANVEFVGLPEEEFRAFDDEGYAKIVWSVEIIPRGAEACLVRMETRVATTDPQSREKFRRYWALLSPGIIATRFELLRLTKRAAERTHSMERHRRPGLPHQTVGYSVK